MDVMFSEDDEIAWVSEADATTEREAREAVARETLQQPDEYVAIPVLLREESEVEAKIACHEFTYYVECTKRAKYSEPYWRVEARASQAEEGK